jgi:concanavalin A-like lectin/glucanase superfamily protein
MLVFPSRPFLWSPGDQIDFADPLGVMLHGYWPCDEAGGKTIIDGLGASPAVYNGSWEASPYGPAAKLNGSSQFLDITSTGSASDPGNGTPTTVGTNIAGSLISIALWLYWRGSTESYNSLLAKEVGGGGWTLLLKSNQFPAYYNSGGGSDPIVSTAVPFNQWVHLCLTYDAAHNIVWYVNGVKVGTSSLGVAGSGLTSANLWVGKSIFGSNRWLNGSVRDVAIWSRAITPAEVWDLYFRRHGSLKKRRTRHLWIVSGAPPVQTITGSTGIVSAEAFGCLPGIVDLVANQDVYGFCSTGIASAEVVGTAGAVAIAPNLVGDAGIPTAEAFGSGGTLTVNTGIVGANGIPSAEAFGVGALIQRTGISVFVANTDVTELMIVDTLEINEPLSQIATASAKFHDKTQGFRPAVGQEVLVYFPGTVLRYGGTVDESIQTAYQALRDVAYEIRCTDFSTLLDRRIVSGYYDGSPAMSTIVSDLVTRYLAQDGISYNSSDGDPGTTIGQQLFNWVTAREAFNRLSSLTGWDFHIGYDKVLRFTPKSTGTGAAPFNIADNDGNWLAESMSVRSYRGKYRNRQYVRSPSQASALWLDTFSVAQPGPYPTSPQPPDGHRQFFVTLYEITAVPIVNRNGVAQRVIALSEVATTPAANWDFYYIPNSFGVQQNFGQTPLTSLEVLTVNYQTQLSPITVISCDAQITARAAIEGNSGIYEDVQDSPSVTDPTAITQYTQGLLNRYGCDSGIPIEVIYKTDKNGLFTGMRQTINTSSPLVASASYILTNVQLRDIQKQFLRATITAQSGEYQGDWQQFYAQLVSRSMQPQPAHFMYYTWDLAPSYPGVTNPGLPSGGIYLVSNVCQHRQEVLQYLSIVFNTMDGSPARNFQLLINGSGAGSTLAPTTPGVEVRTFYIAGIGTTTIVNGDILQILIQGSGGSNYKDGKVTLVTSVAVD